MLRNREVIGIHFVAGRQDCPDSLDLEVDTNSENGGCQHQAAAKRRHAEQPWLCFGSRRISSDVSTVTGINIWT